MSSTVYYDFNPEQLVFFVTDPGMGDLVTRIGRIARITISIVKGKEQTAYEVATAGGSVYCPDVEDIYQADRNYAVEKMTSRIRRAYDQHEEEAKLDAIETAKGRELAKKCPVDSVGPEPIDHHLLQNCTHDEKQAPEVRELIAEAVVEDPGEQSEYFGEE